MERKFYTVTNKSFSDTGATSYKELWDKVSSEGYNGLKTAVVTEIKSKGDNLFHAVFSEAKEDRHREIVKQNFDLKGFKSNPVFIDSHRYESIEHIIGKIHNIKVKDEKLQGDIEFALDNPKGLLAMRLAEGGFLAATSIGFIPNDFDEKGNIERSELLEVSAVSVPALATALIEKAIKTTPPEENLEEEGSSEEETENGSVEPVLDSPTPPEEGESAEKEEKTDTPEAGEGGDEPKEEKSVLVAVAKELQKTNQHNLSEKKRIIYKKLREELKQG